MIGSGKSPTNLEAMSLNYWNIVDLDIYIIRINRLSSVQLGQCINVPCNERIGTIMDMKWRANLEFPLCCAVPELLRYISRTVQGIWMDYHTDKRLYIHLYVPVCQRARTRTCLCVRWEETGIIQEKRYLIFAPGYYNAFRCKRNCNHHHHLLESQRFQENKTAEINKCMISTKRNILLNSNSAICRLCLKPE